MSRSIWYTWLIALVIVLVVRFVSLSAYPLADTTEARYGEIARVMAASGDWVTPQLEPGVPFWAKPPLSFWQGAASVSLFGSTEFAVRLPIFLNILFLLGLVYGLARYVYGPGIGVISTFIIISSFVGFISSGAVMTDSALVFATTLAMISFWLALEQRGAFWGYCFFLALALGFLAKGPVSWVLAGMPIVLWLSIYQKWSEVWNRLPFYDGMVLLLVLIAPWFIISELRTPGFLDYFFVGEHYLRFVESGWTGDRYGTAHDQPRGTIWLYAVVSFAPWSIIALFLIVGWLGKFRAPFRSENVSGFTVYLLVWAIWPATFFTFSGNILPTYVLPGLPAFSILLATALYSTRRPWIFISFGLLMPLTVAFAGPLGLVNLVEKHTQRNLVAHARETYPDLPIAYLGDAPHSARFYSNGTAMFFSNVIDLESWLKKNRAALVAVKDPNLRLTAESDVKLETIGQWNEFNLFIVKSG